MKVIAGHELSYGKLSVHRFMPDPMRMTLVLRDVDLACAAAVERLDPSLYWLSCGTLLGLVRDGGPIDGDIDIDICVDADYENPPEHGDLEAAFDGGKYLALYEISYDDHPIEVMFLDVARRVYVDVFYQYRNFEPGFSWLFAHGGSIRIPEHFIRDRREQETAWGRFVLPHPTEEYLEYHYGENWKTPEDRLEGSWWQAPCRVPW